MATFERFVRRLKKNHEHSSQITAVSRWWSAVFSYKHILFISFEFLATLATKGETTRTKREPREGSLGRSASSDLQEASKMPPVFFRKYLRCTKGRTPGFLITQVYFNIRWIQPYGRGEELSPSPSPSPGWASGVCSPSPHTGARPGACLPGSTVSRAPRGPAASCSTHGGSSGPDRTTLSTGERR